MEDATGSTQGFTTRCPFALIISLKEANRDMLMINCHTSPPVIVACSLAQRRNLPEGGVSSHINLHPIILAPTETFLFGLTLSDDASVVI